MKTYIIIVSTRFPMSLQCAGLPTGFPDAILAKQKLHTIRSNYPLWASRIAQVQAGTAQLSIRTWTGLPYRSKQEEVCTFTHLDGVGIQSLTLYPGDEHPPDTILIDEQPCPSAWVPTIARHDGLTAELFDAWFEAYDKRQQLAIIHFTPCRYRIITEGKIRTAPASL